MSEIPAKNSFDWYSAWQFILSLLACALLLMGGLLFAGFGLAARLLPGFSGIGVPSEQMLVMFVFASSLFACALLCLPSAYYSFRRLSGRPRKEFPQYPGIFRPTLLIFFLPIVLLLGYWISKNPGIDWLALPFLHILAIGLPVLWVLYISIRKLPLGSPQRAWGVLGSGVVLGPAVILVLETFALILFGVAFLLVLSNQTELIEQLSILADQIMTGQTSQDAMISQIIPLISQPGIILAALFFIAVLVPLLEEAFKPIGVWLLVSFKLSPAAGFAAGAICGAGFAFFESLLLTTPGSEWAILATARIGTAVIHILNSALMGWALAASWRDNRYLRLGGTYLLVVFIHGLWNSLALVDLINAAWKEAGVQPSLPVVAWLGPISPYLLVALSATGFAVLLWFNLRLQRTLPAAKSDPEAGSEAKLSGNEPSNGVL